MGNTVFYQTTVYNHLGEVVKVARFKRLTTCAKTHGLKYPNLWNRVNNAKSSVLKSKGIEISDGVKLQLINSELEPAFVYSDGKKKIFFQFEEDS